MSVKLGKCLQVLLTVVCIVLGLAASQGTEYYLSYDNVTGLLHFRCPLDSDFINNKLIVATFGRYNQRTTSGQVSRLANWYNNSATKYENTGNVVLTTRRYGLKGYLTDVRCEDALTYYCSYYFNESNGRISTRRDNFTFTFEGPPSVTMEKPQNAHHCPGDKMEVTCRAFLGRQTNSIVWESRLPDGQFVLDTDSNISYSVNDVMHVQTPIDTKSCNYYAESTLSRDVTAADHRRKWRCRLSFGHAADSFIVNIGSCLKVRSEDSTAPPLLTSPQPLNISEDSPWVKAIFIVVPLLLTGVIVIFFFSRKIIHKHANSKSREDVETDPQMATTRAHNNDGQTSMNP